MSHPSLGILARTLNNYRLSQLLYKVYYDLIKKNEIKKYVFDENIHQPKAVGLNFYNGFVNDHLKISILDNKIKTNILNTNFSCDIENIWENKEVSDLVNFNFNYLGFLSTSLPMKEKLFLLEDHIKKSKNGGNNFISEPYVISLKLIEIIRFISINSIRKKIYEKYLYDQTLFLLRRLEKELMGNHFLYNGIGLLFSAYFFKNKKFFTLAEKILEGQLKEQFLKDGMHFELSPMYQGIIINDLLKCYDLIIKNKNKNKKLQKNLINTLEKGIGYYNFICVDGRYPNFNDSFYLPELNLKMINKKASDLNIYPKKIKQSLDSGYRKYTSGETIIIFDAAQIGPRYQPGHAHADNLTFNFYYKFKPVIVDTGTSVYEDTPRRFLERSTESHNTIKYRNQNSSEVWSSFRVGRIAETFIEYENENKIIAYHDGYKNLNLIHKRSIEIYDKNFKIRDEVTNDKMVKSYLHFHPKINVQLVENKIILDNALVIKLNNFIEVRIEPYFFARGYNDLQKATKFAGEMRNWSEFIIKEI